MARYEVRTGDRLLSKHRTRQGALDRWRTSHVAVPVSIWRTYSTGRAVLVVEGTWHASDDLDE